MNKFLNFLLCYFPAFLIACNVLRYHTGMSVCEVRNTVLR